MRAVTSRHPPGVVVILTGDLTRYADTMSDLAVLQVPDKSGEVWFKGCLIADGLNKGMAHVYDRPGLDWVWLMGDDHRLPPDVLMRLLDRDVDVVIPMCLHRSVPFNTNVVDYGAKRAKTLDEFPTSGLYRLGDTETCGDAGMLIRKRVLDAIERPWYDSRRSGSFSSEDQAFTHRVRQAGFDVHVDCDVRIGHITPMSVAPVTVDGAWKVRIDAGDEIAGLLDPGAADAAG